MCQEHQETLAHRARTAPLALMAPKETEVEGDRRETEVTPVDRLDSELRATGEIQDLLDRRVTVEAQALMEEKVTEVTQVRVVTPAVMDCQEIEVILELQAGQERKEAEVLVPLEDRVKRATLATLDSLASKVLVERKAVAEVAELKEILVLLAPRASEVKMGGQEAQDLLELREAVVCQGIQV